MKTVLFARVSSREQEESGYSLPSQEKLLMEYAERKGFNIAKKFSISESASGRYQRKTFEEMLAYSKKNNIKIIVCEKVDRLTRNLKDAVSVNEWINSNPEHQVHFVKENCILNKESKSNEKFIWNIKVSVAQYYIDNLSEEVRKGQKEKIAQGWLPTKPPLGYKTTGEQGHKIHVIDKERATLIRRMFEYYASGNYSIKALRLKMHEEGLRNLNGGKIANSRLHELLSYPFYCGKIKWKGQIYEGKQDPIISKELFDMVQEKLVRKTTNPQYRKHLPVFKAKIKCVECGGIITWEIQKGHWYGHCNHYKNCSQKTYVRQEKIEDQLFPYFDKVAPKNEKVLKWLEKALKESHADEKEYTNTQRESFNKIIQRLDSRLETIYDDKLDGKIAPEFYERKFKQYTQEKENALDALNKLGQARTKYYEAGYSIHELAYKAKDIYLSPKATPERKRLLLSYVFAGSVLDDDKILPNYSLAFEFLAKWMPKINKNFEPEQNTAKVLTFSGDLSIAPSNYAMELSELQNKFRTSKKSPVKARPGDFTPTSGSLLRR